MKNISIIILGLLFLGCNVTKFPDKIESNLTEDHFRIKGTKLFVKNIEDFTYYEGVNVFRQSDSVAIHCFYNLYDFEQAFRDKNFEFWHNIDYQILSHKTFSINGDNGIFYKLREGNSFWLYFMYGDELAENRIVATFPISQENFEKVIYDFVKSTYYKKDFELDPLESANFEVNTLNSGFEFSLFTMNQYIFVQNPKEISENPEKFSGRFNALTFQQFPPTNDTTMLTNTLNTIAKHIKANGVVVERLHFGNNTKIDFEPEYYFVLRGKFENQEIYSKMIISSQGLMYGTTLYHNIEENILLTDTILKTVMIKK
jgi:hypothetical protein